MKKMERDMKELRDRFNQQAARRLREDQVSVQIKTVMIINYSSLNSIIIIHIITNYSVCVCVCVCSMMTIQHPPSTGNPVNSDFLTLTHQILPTRAGSAGHARTRGTRNQCHTHIWDVNIPDLSTRRRMSLNLPLTSSLLELHPSPLESKNPCMGLRPLLVVALVAVNTCICVSSNKENAARDKY